jgi:hypothetical protein
VARYAGPVPSYDSPGVRCLARELLAGVGGPRWHEQLFFRARARTGSTDRALDVVRYAMTAYPHGPAKARDVGPRRYGRWVTIGAREGEDGRRHGGSPVYVEDGRITKGAPALTGRKIDALREEGEYGTHRQQLR